MEHGRRIAGAAVVLGGLLLSGCGFQDVATSDFTDDSAVDQQITNVRVINSSGHVRISTGDRATVHRTVHYSESRPGPTHRVEGDVLILDSCAERGCWVDYDVVVPAGARVVGAVDSGDLEATGVASLDLKASSGDVTVSGVGGKVNIEAHSGSVRLTDIADAVTVRAHSGDVVADNVRAGLFVQAASGDVQASGIGGAADVESSSGDVSVRTTVAEDVRVQAHSGDVTVTVPQGPYQVRADSDSGDVSTDVTDDSTGRHRLDLHTDSGNIDLAYG